MADWYYAHNEEQFGPVSAAALREMAQQGRLQRDDLIWREGMQRWAPAHKVRGLFPSESESPAPVGENGQWPPRGESPPASALAPEAPPFTAQPAEAARESDSEIPNPRIPNPKSESDEAADEVAAIDTPSEETAIDALPLGGPEDSKLHVPALGAPGSPPGRHESDVVVVFEPAQTTPRPAADPAKKAAESDDRRPGPAAAAKHTRIDVPGGRGRFGENAALFLQTFTWVSCLLVILAGGAVYIAALVMTQDAGRRLAASGIYAAFVLSAYVLAHTTERICRVLGQWFGTSTETKTRRLVRERNWKRFQ